MARFLFRALETHILLSLPFFFSPLNAPKVTEQGDPTWQSTTGQWSNGAVSSQILPHLLRITENQGFSARIAPEPLHPEAQIIAVRSLRAHTAQISAPTDVKTQAFVLKLLLTVVFDIGRSCLKMWPHLSYDSRNKDRLKIYQHCSAPVIKAGLNKQCSLSVKCTGLWTTIHFT